MKLFRRALLLVSIACMLWFTLANWNQAKPHISNIDPVWFSYSLALLLLALVTGPLGWYLALRQLSQKTGFRDTFCAWTLSSVAKYVPGAIWTFVGRSVWARERELHMPSVTVSMYMEQVILVISAFAIGMPLLLTHAEIRVDPMLMLLCVGVLAFSVHPKALRLAGKLFKRFERPLNEVRLPSGQCLLRLYFFYTVHWLIFALGFFCFVRSVHVVGWDDIFVLTQILAIAYGVSMVAIIFPSGIGIRESILYLLLTPYLPAPVCLVIAIGSRLWLVAGEMAILSVIPFINAGARAQPVSNAGESGD